MLKTHTDSTLRKGTKPVDIIQAPQSVWIEFDNVELAALLTGARISTKSGSLMDSAIAHRAHTQQWLASTDGAYGDWKEFVHRFVHMVEQLAAANEQAERDGTLMTLEQFADGRCGVCNTPLDDHEEECSNDDQD